VVPARFLSMKNCPICKTHTSLREVVYGLPEGPLDEEKYAIGGCCISESDPSLICVECGWEGLHVNNIGRLDSTS
jgi:hypothetical protein